jgi:hypothetical protein
MSSTLYVQRVIELVYVGSHWHSCNLTNMHRKASACIGLRMAMVPELYQCSKDPWLGQSTNDIQRITVPSLPYMGVHMMAEGAVVSCGPIPMCPQLVRCHSGPSDEGGWKSSTSGESTSRKSSGHQYGSRRL